MSPEVVSDNPNRPAAHTQYDNEAKDPPKQKSKIAATLYLLSLLTVLLLPAVYLSSSQVPSNPPSVHRRTTSSTTSSNPSLLSSDSVILITGAAGFLGSSLAIALHQTYNPSLIILVDSLDTHPAIERQRASAASTRNYEEYQKKLSETFERTEDQLANMEYKRQRVFYLLQTLGEKCVFYRSDLRPSIPEFWNVGEVPLLDRLIKKYDLTHVVHLADAGEESLAIPRVKDQTKAGMIESMLEMLKTLKDQGKHPHFVYGSSWEVYGKEGIHSEKDVMEAPNSLKGAGKLMDEILAMTYSDMYGIYSVGLRFFKVYGPWGNPSSLLFEMAERAVSDSSLKVLSSDVNPDDVFDYVYIDDAVDAIMMALQYRPAGEESNPALVFNVGTGVGSSNKQLRDMMQYYFPRSSKKTTRESPSNDNVKALSSIADTSLSKQHLGFQPLTSIKEGIIQTLAWHYDRGLPYSDPPADSQKYHNAFIVSQGYTTCNPFDMDCLKGAPVFPCASECAKASLCTPSLYDQAMDYTQKLTKGCTMVLYTLALDPDLVSIPSATFGVMPDSTPFIQDSERECNIAFVTETSPLFQSTQSTKHKTGFWKLVSIPQSSHSTPLFERPLPKFSPSKFFPDAKLAVYADPTILFHNLPLLLKKMYLPYPKVENSVIASLISYQKRSYTKQPKHIFQERAYDMMYIAFLGDMKYTRSMNPSWMIHKLQDDDTKLLRCDVYSEIVQWRAESGEKALEFVSGLHDLWSQVVYKDERRKLEETGEEEEEEEMGEEEESEEGNEKEEAYANVVQVEKKEGVEQKKEGKEENADGDWLGVLSSEGKRYFVRVLESDEGIVVHLDDYNI